MISFGLGFILLSKSVCSANTWVVGSDDVEDAIDAVEVKNNLEEMEASVAVAIIIQNQSRLKLQLEQLDVSCGVFTNNDTLPEELWPGETSIVTMEKVRLLLTSGAELCRA